MNQLSAIFLTTLCIYGCGEPCSDPGRINGEWIASAWIGNQTGGSNVENHPLHDAPILSKTMPWTATFLGVQDEVDLRIGPDEHIAQYIKDPEDCDEFALNIRGVYEVETLNADGEITASTQHEFLYEAKLRYTGPRIIGTFQYRDAWEGLVSDQLGSLQIDDAELMLSSRE